MLFTASLVPGAESMRLFVNFEDTDVEHRLHTTNTELLLYELADQKNVLLFREEIPYVFYHFREGENGPSFRK